MTYSLSPTVSRLRRSEGAFTIVDCLCGVAIILIAFVTLFGLSAQSLGVLNSSRNHARAQRMLQDRSERLRACKWAEITDAAFVRTSILSGHQSAAILGGVTETITINAYPTALGTAMRVVRTGGVSTITTSNPALVNEDLVRVDLAVTWSGGAGNRQQSESISTLIGENPL